MPTFSKFLNGFRGCKQVLDSDEYIYSRKKKVVTDYHLDRLAVGKTPSKKRRISSSILYDLCSFYLTYPTKIEYLFAVAKYFGNNIE